MAKAIKRAHASELRPDAATILRFLALIDFNGPTLTPDLGPCWLWKGYADGHGYGQFKWGGRAWWAYRVSWLIFNGPLIDGMQKNHRCTNSRCVNPDHIEAMTPAENVAERNRRIAAANRMTV